MRGGKQIGSIAASVKLSRDQSASTQHFKADMSEFSLDIFAAPFTNMSPFSIESLKIRIFLNIIINYLSGLLHLLECLKNFI